MEGYGLQIPQPHGRQGRGCLCVMAEKMIKQYLEHHFEPNQDDDFRWSRASGTRREVDAWVGTFSARGLNSPALADGC